MTFTRHEVRTPDDQGLCGIVTERAVSVRRNKTVGVVTVWATVDPAEGYASAAVDPLLEGPLQLVSLDMDGREIARVDVPETGTAPETAITMDRVRPLVPPGRKDRPTPALPPNATADRPGITTTGKATP